MSCECDSRINVGSLNERAGLSSLLDFDMMVKLCCGITCYYRSFLKTQYRKDTTQYKIKTQNQLAKCHGNPVIAATSSIYFDQTLFK